MKNIIKTSFSKFFLTHLAVMMIPCFLIIFYFYPKIDSILMDKMFTDHHAMLTAVKDNVEFQLDNIHPLPVAIKHNALLSEYNLKNSSLDRFKAKDEIGKYINTNSFIEDVLIYMKDFDYIIHKQGTSSMEDFGDEFLNYEGFSKKALESLVENSPKPKVIRSQPVSNLEGNRVFNLVTFIFPLNSYTKSSLMVLVRESDFVELISSVSKNYGGDIYVTDPFYNTIVATHNRILPDSDDIIREIKDLDGTHIITHENKKYVVSIVDSATYQWHYISIIPYEIIGKDILIVKKTMIALIIAFFLIAMIAIYYLSKLNYRPLKALLSYMNISTNAKVTENEYNKIRDKFDTLSEQNQQLHTRINKNIPATTDYLIHGLVNNRITTLQEFNTAGSRLDIHLEGNYYNCSLIKLKEGFSAELSGDTVIHAIMKDLPSHITGFFASGFTRNSLLFITGSYEKDDLKHYLEEQLSIEPLKDWVYLGMSQDFYNVIHMNKAYVQASSVLDYLVMRDQVGILNYQELPFFTATTCYPSHVIYNFKMALLQQNKAKANKLFEQLMDILRSPKTSVTTVRTLTYDLSYLMTELDPTGTEQRQLVIGPDTNIHMICDHVNRLFTNLLSHVQDEQEEEETKDEVTITLILTYINEHYHEYDISLQQIADHFHMSSSSLSRFIKKNTDITFKHYLNTLRINKGQQLLEQTDLTINEISQSLGYSNASSFIRVFKSQMDMSPGQFRKDHKKN